jgi:hypothetical protein
VKFILKWRHHLLRLDRVTAGFGQTVIIENVSFAIERTVCWPCSAQRSEKSTVKPSPN